MVNKTWLFCRNSETFIYLLCFAVLVLITGMPVSGIEEAGHGEAGAHEESIWQTIGKWVNFAALVAILILFFTKGLRIQDKFRGDAEEIRGSIEAARAAKEEAEKRLQEMDARMAQVNEDIARMKENARIEAEEERRRILDSAQKEAGRLVETARREIDTEVLKAKKDLRRHVADLAVTHGHRIIEEEVNEADQKNLIQQYIESFEK